MACTHFRNKFKGISDQFKEVLLIVLGDYYLCPACKQRHRMEELNDGKEEAQV